MPRPPARIRDAERSRAAILAAAETMFAERGYADTTMADVGHAAGLSRGSPGYFFVSKHGLYRAVIAKCFADALDAVRSGKLRAERSGKPPVEVLAGAVSEYVDFVSAHPNFVRLLHWEALGLGPADPSRPEGFALGAEAVAALAEQLGYPVAARSAIRHVVLSLVALTWFPELHKDSLVPALGLDPASPAYLTQRKRHITALLTAALPVRRPGAR